ncbi:MAG: hypothetical protein J5713_03220 [Clostridia bacterium]|nr:hypothetical protein [Clostridia bacterium]
MNKKVIISIIAVILLVAVLGTVLVACNKEDYEKRLEKKGYSFGSVTDLLGAAGLQSSTVEWSLSAAKDNESVSIVKYRNSDDAKDAYDSYKKNLKDGYAVRRHGKIVVYGTKQGVKDAE